MSSELAIKVENLSKCYQIYDKPRDRLAQMFFWGRKQFYREFWALKDVSFEIKKGETVGIIGRNGSGKSTLLQLICGTLAQTTGTIQTKGRVAALLELGSGFNPEFTGRENVYMNAAVLGLAKKEIDDRFDAIAGFADIGEFIDQPVKTYSSGMIVRLAFAVQAQVNPDILIVDEALAVGDAKFQAKCFDQLKRLKLQGTSILLVTHSTEQIVTHCDQSILLDHGQMIDSGSPRSIANHYLDLLFGPNKEKIHGSTGELAQERNHEHEVHQSALPAYMDLSYTLDRFAERCGYNPHEHRWGDGKACILDYCLGSNIKRNTASFEVGDNIVLVFSIAFRVELICPIFGIVIKTKEGVTVCGLNTKQAGYASFSSLGQRDSIARVGVHFKCGLAPGDYFISVGVATQDVDKAIPHDRRYDVIHLQVRPHNNFIGLADLNMKFSTV